MTWLKYMKMKSGSGNGTREVDLERVCVPVWQVPQRNQFQVTERSKLSFGIVSLALAEMAVRKRIPLKEEPERLNLRSSGQALIIAEDDGDHVPGSGGGVWLRGLATARLQKSPEDSISITEGLSTPCFLLCCSQQPDIRTSLDVYQQKNG